MESSTEKDREENIGRDRKESAGDIEEAESRTRAQEEREWRKEKKQEHEEGQGALIGKLHRHRLRQHCSQQMMNRVSRCRFRNLLNGLRSWLRKKIWRLNMS